jgi:hypothetical protein
LKVVAALVAWKKVVGSLSCSNDTKDFEGVPYQGVGCTSFQVLNELLEAQQVQGLRERFVQEVPNGR